MTVDRAPVQTLAPIDDAPALTHASSTFTRVTASHQRVMPALAREAA
jgi:hypothetical protein